MDVRLILKEDSGRRFTLPVKGVSRIEWTEDAPGGAPVAEIERGQVTCYGVHGKLEMPAASLITIYRDDAAQARRRGAGSGSARGQGGAGAAKRGRRTRTKPDAEPTASDAEPASALGPPE